MDGNVKKIHVCKVRDAGGGQWGMRTARGNGWGDEILVDHGSVVVGGSDRLRDQFEAMRRVSDAFSAERDEFFAYFSIDDLKEIKKFHDESS